MTFTCNVANFESRTYVRMINGIKSTYVLFSLNTTNTKRGSSSQDAALWDFFWTARHFLLIEIFLLVGIWLVQILEISIYHTLFRYILMLKIYYIPLKM